MQMILLPFTPDWRGLGAFAVIAIRMHTHRVVPPGVDLEAAMGSLGVAAPPLGQPFRPQQFVGVRRGRRGRRKPDGGFRLWSRGATLGDIEAGCQHGSADAGRESICEKFHGLFPAQQGKFAKCRQRPQ